MKLDMQLSACTSWTSELSDIPLSLTCSRQYQINSEKNHSYTFTKSTISALDEDIWNTTKEKVAHELPIKISTQFPVTQGVTWKETADEWREITQSRTGN